MSGNIAESSASSMPTMAPHVLMFSDPLGLNVCQLHALARALASAIPQTVFSFLASQETLASLVQTSPNLLHIFFDHGMPNVKMSARFFNDFLASGPIIYQRMLNVAAFDARRNVTHVVSDAFTWIADSMEKQKKILWIVLYSGFPLAMLTHLYKDRLTINFPIKKCKAAFLQDSLKIDPVFEVMRIGDLPVGIVSGGVDNNYAFQTKAMMKILQGADVIVIPSLPGFPKLDFFHPFELKRVYLISPLHLLSPLPPKFETEDCLEWLHKQLPRSVMYISLGVYSAIPLPPPELIEVAYGLENSQVPFLWCIKADERCFLPEGFVQRTRAQGMLVSWAPQLSVLNHLSVDFFFNLSEWKDVLDNISARVPMFCRAFHGEGRMSARGGTGNLGYRLKF